MFTVRLELNFYVFVIGLNWIFCLIIVIIMMTIISIDGKLHHSHCRDKCSCIL